MRYYGSLIDRDRPQFLIGGIIARLPGTAIFPEDLVTETLRRDRRRLIRERRSHPRDEVRGVAIIDHSPKAARAPTLSHDIRRAQDPIKSSSARVVRC
jgi:hypothetical protein